MPEMATVCQETSGTPPNMFGPRNAQGVGPPHGYYNHCGYPTSSGHPQYSNDGYVSFQTSQTEHPSHLQHHMHGRQQQHHQQTWDYSMGVGVMGTSRHGVLADDWTQCYLLPGSSAPAQNSYNYQYRGTPSHGALDYTPSLQAGHEADVHVLEGSPSPNSSSPGEATTSAMGPNNQGAKSLRPPYEWMKPTAALPQAGKTRTKDKYRVVYSDHQRLELEKEFHFSKYITIRRKAEIASQLGLSERQDIGVNISIFQLIVDFLARLRSVVCHCFLNGRLTYPVKIWFQNRRAKERKQNKKREEQVSIHQHGGSANNSGDLQQHIQHPSNHEPLPHPFIPKIELEDEKSSMHELACHNTNHAQVAGLTSHAATPTSIVLPQSPFLHHSPNMVMSPIIMSRGHTHPAVGRYHDNVQTTISPNTGHDEVVYRMTVNSDNSGNNMNLSGSSDSGVVSAH